MTDTATEMAQASEKVQQAPREAAGPRFPDFIIGGAPKCGTTSLHFILGQHPEISMPDEEIHYFDADDPIVHPDFFFYSGGKLEWFDARPEDKPNLDWYAGRFASFPRTACIGEDSTTYLHSASAPDRIKALIPDVKLIFMLRNPVARAYSQYWHLVMTARATCSFEEALTRFPVIVIGSSYVDALRRYYDCFGRDAVKVVFFEDFVADNQAAIDDVTAYLSLDPMEVKPDASWFNKTKYPSRLETQLMLNQVGSRIVRQRYRNHTGQKTGLAQKIRHKLHYWWFARINPVFLKNDRPPPMSEETRAYLTQHLIARNKGLSDLIGRDLSEIWPGFEV
ncbi:sulfotransferase [Rhodobacteraceae bacterium NNCM2]|nr:sulfotransferase [Coraliihabitans acroporae]